MFERLSKSRNGGGVRDTAMPVKINIQQKRSETVEVKVRRPKWQQFISY